MAIIGYEVTYIPSADDMPANLGSLPPDQRNARIAELEDACRLLVSSHDVGDRDGEARGWLAIRAALVKK